MTPKDALAAKLEAVMRRFEGLLQGPVVKQRLKNPEPFPFERLPLLSQLHTPQGASWSALSSAQPPRSFSSGIRLSAQEARRQEFFGRSKFEAALPSVHLR